MQSANRLIAVTLDENTIERSTPNVDHERAIAIYDLIEQNSFQPLAVGGEPLGDDHCGPYKLRIAIVEQRLVFEIVREDDTPVTTHILSLSPFKRIIRDYFMICDSYYAAIRTATPAQIESIDMGRRGLHNEGSEVLQERLKGKILLDFETARRLFTLISVLHWKG